MWLQGIRTYLAVNDSAVVAAKQQEATVFQETWEYFADDQQLKALHPGDSRAALAPFLAHQVTIGLPCATISILSQQVLEQPLGYQETTGV